LSAFQLNNRLVNSGSEFAHMQGSALSSQSPRDGNGSSFVTHVSHHTVDPWPLHTFLRMAAWHQKAHGMVVLDNPYGLYCKKIVD